MLLLSALPNSTGDYLIVIFGLGQQTSHNMTNRGFYLYSSIFHDTNLKKNSRHSVISPVLECIFCCLALVLSLLSFSSLVLQILLILIPTQLTSHLFHMVFSKYLNIYVQSSLALVIYIFAT